MLEAIVWWVQSRACTVSLGNSQQRGSWPRCCSPFPVRVEHVGRFDAFFVHSGDYEEAQFRVIDWIHSEAMAAVFVYPSLSVTWTAGTSASWEALGLHQEERMTPPSWWSSYVYGCLYCKALKSNKFLKLDVNRMEFSAVSLLPNHENRQVLVVEAGEGKIGIPGRIFGQEIPESWRYSIR
ncbi:hypothetical protein SEVIR_3G096850v4 [Setaria viridis]